MRSSEANHIWGDDVECDRIRKDLADQLQGDAACENEQAAAVRAGTRCARLDCSSRSNDDMGVGRAGVPSGIAAPGVDGLQAIRAHRTWL